MLFALFFASVAAAQSVSPFAALGLNISAQCQQSVLGLLTNSSFANCSHAADLAPLLTSNTSAIPVLDKFMSDVCYSNACTNDTLTQAAQTIITGCASDLNATGAIVTPQVVQTGFALYPLIREILCLKTSQPYTNASYGGALGAPPIPVTAYNSTGGYFCVSSFLTQLSAYFGTNITVPYVISLLNGTNSTATSLAKAIDPNVICNGCIFAGLDLVEQYYPSVGNNSFAPVVAVLGINATIPPNATVNQVFNGECAYVPLMVSTNGTLPANISVSIVNSTYPYNITNGK